MKPLEYITLALYVVAFRVVDKIGEYKQRKVTEKYLLRALMEYQTWYGINILFCDNKKNAFKVTQSIFKRLNEMFHGQD